MPTVKPYLLSNSHDGSFHPIRRSSPTTHHGRTLAILGHAADHIRVTGVDDASNREAVHILMHHGRQVFDEYVTITHTPRPFTDWIMRQAIRLYDAA